ncbi:hypothetical protein WJ08_19460 [Burkholderia vietnamiensis]|nr:hypothetical protein WJ08_19460 [Burkholderia vietnamiensis]KVF36596.1 hypothetical protein WJ10_27460 [Burkholderia vietnamiensis]
MASHDSRLLLESFKFRRWPAFPDQEARQEQLADEKGRQRIQHDRHASRGRSERAYAVATVIRIVVGRPAVE